jgi:hypothetical protein
MNHEPLTRLAAWLLATLSPQAGRGQNAAFSPLFRRIGIASRGRAISLRPGLKRAIVPENWG